MSVQDIYERALWELPGRALDAERSGRIPVFGFTSNLDVVLHWNADTYNDILAAYLKDDPAMTKGDEITSMEDFARITSWYILRGRGGNHVIRELSVCNYLREHFAAEYSLGGTAAQGTAALGAMGVPVCIHMTDRCREVCSLLDYPLVTTVSDRKVLPVGRSANEAAPVYHFILQFSKGDVVRIGGKDVVIPHSNRIILFYDNVHSYVPVQEGFLQHMEEAPVEPSSCLLSGFDAILEEGRMKGLAERLFVYAERMKQKAPDMMVYLEGAFYMNPAVKEQAFRILSPCADILGMNEEELEDRLCAGGMQPDLESMQGIVQALEAMLSLYPARGIILHTKDYAAYYGDRREGIDLEAGLAMGNLMASTRARTGRYGTREECAESLLIPLSEKGERLRRQAMEMKTERELLVVPSRLMEHPKYTIGLGDTFAAGVHTCFLK